MSYEEEEEEEEEGQDCCVATKIQRFAQHNCEIEQLF